MSHYAHFAERALLQRRFNNITLSQRRYHTFHNFSVCRVCILGDDILFTFRHQLVYEASNKTEKFFNTLILVHLVTVHICRAA